MQHVWPILGFDSTTRSFVAMESISIVVADAQFLVRQGLKHLIARHPGMLLAGEAKSSKELSEVVTERRPMVVILDHDQPGYFDLSSIGVVKDCSPASNILVISADNQKQSVYRVLESGVHSFLTKTCGADEIIDAIRATARGEKFYCTKIIDYLLEKSFSKETEDYAAPALLTPRELEIVRLVGQGLIAKEIARILNLSTHTVYTHRKNIMKKLDLNTSSELVLFAVNHGIV